MDKKVKKVKVRHFWRLNPVEQIKDHKRYNRKVDKVNVKKELIYGD